MGNGEDMEEKRDALYWRIFAEALEGESGKAELDHLIRVLDRCAAKAAIGMGAISHLLGAPREADLLAVLHSRISALRGQQHKMEGTGQTHTFIVKDDVLGWIENCQRRLMEGI